MLSKNKVKYIQTLCHKKQRLQENFFLAEGEKIISELLTQKKYTINELYALPQWVAANKALYKNIPITEISLAELQKISNLTTPNKVLAIVENYTDTEQPNANTQLVLALDGIQDPGNMGTIIRLADWFGIQHILCSHTTVDWQMPKVIQATMGSFVRVTITYTNLANYIVTNNIVNVAIATIHGTDIKKIEPLQNGIIIMGNEGNGISQSLTELATQQISIVRKGNAESLNVAVATGIILSHLV